IGRTGGARVGRALRARRRRRCRSCAAADAADRQDRRNCADSRGDRFGARAGIRALTLALRRFAPAIGALAVCALILSFAPPHTVGPWWALALLAALALAWVGFQPAGTVRDDMLPALAIVLSGLGLAVVARISPELAQRQQAWLFVSLALAIACGPAFTQFRRFASYKYLWVIASLVLFGLLLAFGQEVNGARLWIKL